MAERTWITIDRRAFDQNVRALAWFVRPAKLMPIVKSNAYGHGLENVAVLAQKWPIWGLGVAYGSEALSLRKAGYRGKIAVLAHWEAEKGLTLAKNGVDVVVFDFATLATAFRVASRGVRLNIQLKIDTGTTRIGFLPSDTARLKKLLEHKPAALRVVGVWSHFSSSENSATITKRQELLFRNVVAALGIPAVHHIACTASGIQFPDTRLDVVRAGLGIYGYWPSISVQRYARRHRLQLRPALRWSTRVIQVKDIPTGTFVGYGRTWQAKRRSAIAIIPVGYADGLRRGLSNCGRVQIGGQTYPIVGRVCMNLTMIDVTGGHGVRSGQQVDLIGSRVTVADHAAWAEMIEYEILTGLSSRISRQLI